MGSDFVSEGAAVVVSRDIAKKKKTHRSAKLKQCKLDARREQWLSQGLCSRSAVKNKDCVVAASRSPASSPPPHPALSKKMDIGLKEEEEEEIRVSTERDGSSSHDSEGGSPTHGGNANGCPANSVSSGSSFASSSRSLSDAEVEADDHEIGEEGVDDWETLADELADDHSQPDQNPIATLPDSTAELSRTNKGNQESLGKSEAKQAVNRAWRPDDTLRPQSLPNLSKQRSFPVCMARRCPASGWVQRDILSTPSCPICCEDLDPTDSSFLPCNCGFRLCLFCHKRILEADGRCPGCRKHYAPVAGGEVGIMGEIPTLALRLSRSCSMSSRT